MRWVVAALTVAFVAVVLLWPGHLDGPATTVAVAGAIHGPATMAEVVRAYDVAQAVGNVVLFMPVGFTVAIAARRLWVGALVGVVLSSAGETAQLFIPSRDASILDVALNSVGALLGALLYLPVLHARRRRAPADDG